MGAYRLPTLWCRKHWFSAECELVARRISHLTTSKFSSGRSKERCGCIPIVVREGVSVVANAELLIKLSPLVAEIPFVYDYGVKRGASKINVMRTINEYFVLVAYLRRLTRKFKDYQHRTLT